MPNTILLSLEVSVWVWDIYCTGEAMWEMGLSCIHLKEHFVYLYHSSKPNQAARMLRHLKYTDLCHTKNKKRRGGGGKYRNLFSSTKKPQ
mgnify:CR=1 FL=1